MALRIVETTCLECGVGTLKIQYQQWMSFYVVACDNPRCPDKIVPKKFNTMKQAEEYLRGEYLRGKEKEDSRAIEISERARGLSAPITTSLREVIAEARDELERQGISNGSTEGGRTMSRGVFSDFFEAGDIPLPRKQKKSEEIAEIRDAVGRLLPNKCILVPIEGLESAEVQSIQNRFQSIRQSLENPMRKFSVRKAYVERNGETVKCIGIWRTS